MSVHRHGCDGRRLLANTVVVSGAARAADLSEPVILVASSRLDPTPLQQAVVLATPLDDGSHIGFMINKPTGVKLQALFPDDPAAGKVTDLVYLGGPAFLPAVFALTRTPPESAGATGPRVIARERPSVPGDEPRKITKSPSKKLEDTFLARAYVAAVAAARWVAGVTSGQLRSLYSSTLSTLGAGS